MAMHIYSLRISLLRRSTVLVTCKSVLRHFFMCESACLLICNCRQYILCGAWHVGWVSCWPAYCRSHRLVVLRKFEFRISTSRSVRTALQHLSLLSSLFGGPAMGVEGRSDDIVPGAATMCVEGICQIGGKEAPDGSQSALESTILHCTRVGGFKCRKPGGEQVDEEMSVPVTKDPGVRTIIGQIKRQWHSHWLKKRLCQESSRDGSWKRTGIAIGRQHRQRRRAWEPAVKATRLKHRKRKRRMTIHTYRYSTERGRRWGASTTGRETIGGYRIIIIFLQHWPARHSVWQSS